MCDARPPEELARFSGAEVGSLASGGVRLPLRLVVATAWPDGRPAFERDSARAYLARLAAETADALAPCGVSLDVERATVLAVPARWLALDANLPGDWGGLAPAGVDADAWNADAGARLPADVHALLDAARGDAPEGTLVAVVVDDVSYHAAGQRTRAGGFSFPARVYHHPDDVPARDAVLVASAYLRCGALPMPLHPRVVAHELGHMLLDTAKHDADADRVMSSMLGPSFSPDQCATIRERASSRHDAVTRAARR